MRFQWNRRKTRTSLLLVASLFLLSNCQFGTAPQGGQQTNISGQGIKGPFQVGATVTAREVNSPNRTATGSITDNLGNYSVTTSWDGPTTIEISGAFKDDFTGAISNQPASSPLRAVINATAGGNASGQVNLATSIAAQAVLSLQASGTTVTSSVVNAQNLATAQKILGTSSNADISQVNLSTTSSSSAGQVLAFVLAVAAQSGTSDVTTAISQLASNVVNSVPFGTAVAGTTSPITATQLQTNLSTIRDGGNLTVTGVGTVSTATALANVGTGQTTSSISSQVNPNNVSTVPSGFAIRGNNVTIGAATATVNSAGTATVTGTTAKTNVLVGFNFMDYSNQAGTGPAGATTYNVVFNFSISPASGSDQRTITGTVTSVTVATNGTGGVSVSVPANATMTFSGRNSAGATVTGSATNLTADSAFFTSGTTTANGTPVTINANTLLNLISSKVGGQLQSLNTAGTFNFSFGFSLPIGTENNGGTGISALFPQGSTTGFGYTFGGMITLT
jgi:hypothetical protein